MSIEARTVRFGKGHVSPNRPFPTRRYGLLAVVEKGTHGRKLITKWRCKCDCGVEREIFQDQLVAGRARSCGTCKENQRRAATVHGATAGGKPTAEFRIWKGIKERCTNAASKSYPRYGGRGIRICDRWAQSFQNFVDDVGPRPTMRHSLDRYPENNGHYEPGNVRWTTPKQQSANRQNSRLLTIDGETRPLYDWAPVLGISRSTIWYWLKKKGLTEQQIAAKAIARRDARKESPCT